MTVTCSSSPTEIQQWNFEKLYVDKVFLLRIQNLIEQIFPIFLTWSVIDQDEEDILVNF